MGDRGRRGPLINLETLISGWVTCEARRDFEQAVTILREIGDRHGEGQALGCLGLVFANCGEPRLAIDFFGQYLVIARDIGDRHGEGNALGSLGVAHSAPEEHQRAIEYHEQHLAVAREIGDRRGESQAWGNLANAYQALGELRDAISYDQRRLPFSRGRRPTRRGSYPSQPRQCLCCHGECGADWSGKLLL